MELELWKLKRVLQKFIFILTKQSVELHKLTLEVRRRDKTLAFVNKAYDNALAHPELVPSYLDLAEMKKDLDAVAALNSIIRPLQEQVDLLNDTAMIAGSEGYSSALVFYNAVKSAYKAGVPVAKTVHNELQERFVTKRAVKEEGKEESKEVKE